MGGLDTALGVFTSIHAGNIQKDATQKAIDAQRQAQDQSIAFQREQTQKALDFLGSQNAQARADLEPFRQSQLSALSQLQGLADPNAQYYQDQRNVNTQAIQRQLAAQGLLRSKKQSDLLTNLELGLNQQRQSILGDLAGSGAVQQGAAGLQALGQQVAGLQSGLGQSVGSTFMQGGSQLAQLQQAMGQARAMPWIGANNAIQSKIGQLQQLALLGAGSGMFGGGAAGGTAGGTGLGPYMSARAGAFAPFSLGYGS